MTSRERGSSRREERSNAVCAARHGRARLFVGVTALGAAAALLALEPFHGSVFFSLSGRHGVDAGDLIALPIVLFALLMLRDSPASAVASEASRATSARGWDLVTIGLLSGGAALILAELFDALEVSSSLAHAGFLPLAAVGVSLGVLVLGLAVNDDRHDVFGAPLAIALVVLLAGLQIDSTDGPAGSVVGPTFLALFLAVTVGRARPLVRSSFVAVAVVLLAVDVAALVDVTLGESLREGGGGGFTRSGALGLVLVTLGVSRLLARTTRPTPAQPGRKTRRGTSSLERVRYRRRREGGCASWRITRYSE
jgi:hypothetical protein